MAVTTAKYRITGLVEANLLKSSGGEDPTVTKIPVDFPNGVKWESDIVEIPFEGGGKKALVFGMAGLTAELGADTFDLAAMNSLFGIQEVTSGLPDGVAKRSYMGTSLDTAGVKGGLETICTAQNLTTNATCKVALTAHVGTFSPLMPGEMKTQAKGPMTVKFSADQTDKDMAGTALPSCPTGGCFWTWDELE